MCDFNRQSQVESRIWRIVRLTQCYLLQQYTLFLLHENTKHSFSFLSPSSPRFPYPSFPLLFCLLFRGRPIPKRGSAEAKSSLEKPYESRHRSKRGRKGERDEMDEREVSLWRKDKKRRRERKTKTGSRRLQTIRALFDLSSLS